MESYIGDIRQEREKAKIQWNEEIQRREMQREERRAECAKMHEDKMKIQQSLIDILHKLTDAKK